MDSIKKIKAVNTNIRDLKNIELIQRIVKDTFGIDEITVNEIGVANGSQIVVYFTHKNIYFCAACGLAYDGSGYFKDLTILESDEILIQTSV